LAGDEYGLVLCKAFEQKIKERYGSLEGWDDIQMNFDERLSRYPDAGQLITGTDGVYALLVAIHNVTVYYRVDHGKHEIEFLDLD
jgi:hypothetical protein